MGIFYWLPREPLSDRRTAPHVAADANHNEESHMKRYALITTAIVTTFAVSAPVAAAGCLKGAAVGGVAGHFAGHHAILGAAAGCAIGHHRATVAARERVAQARAVPATAPASAAVPR